MHEKGYINKKLALVKFCKEHPAASSGIDFNSIVLATEQRIRISIQKQMDCYRCREGKDIEGFATSGITNWIRYFCYEK